MATGRRLRPRGLAREAVDLPVPPKRKELPGFAESVRRFDSVAHR
ncbi:protein of unknown function [Burkholderia multivorans]